MQRWSTGLTGSVQSCAPLLNRSGPRVATGEGGEIETRREMVRLPPAAPFRCCTLASGLARQDRGAVVQRYRTGSARPSITRLRPTARSALVMWSMRERRSGLVRRPTVVSDSPSRPARACLVMP